MKLFALFISLIFISCSASKNRDTATENRLPINLSDTLLKDTLMFFEAHPQRGFNYSYYLYLPRGLKRASATRLLVEGNNSGVNDTMDVHKAGARYSASKSSVGNFVSKRLKVPLLVPVFPRPASQWEVYTHALDKEALHLQEGSMKRLDLQLIAMIKHAKAGLSTNHIVVKDKFFITGFSASGTFANRFSLLHPELIQASAYGGINSIAILPVTKLGATALKYPLGISDVKAITGKRVNQQAFRVLPQFLFMGALDENDAVAFDDAYDDEERQIVYDLMGKKMHPDRWQFIQDIYKLHTTGAQFATYTHMGHGTDLRINNEVVNFFRKNL